MSLLAVDVGTTSLKMGVYTDALDLVCPFQKAYPIQIHDQGAADVDVNLWWLAFVEGCKEMGDALSGIDLVSFSGTTPGFVCMDRTGRALLPAILFMDGRSRKQAAAIRERIGEDVLLEQTANLPVSGGCSLSSLLWIAAHHPDVFNATACFGHSNTYMVKRLTNHFAMDPSSASLTCLYNTTANDLTWNTRIVETFGISMGQLPKLMPAYASAGGVTAEAAAEVGIKQGTPVLIGGNDAVLAALSGEIIHPGDVCNVNGTCEITSVCLDKCLPSANYNIRAHAIPGRWLTLYVMNTGGKALEWFFETFCGDLEAETFYGDFLSDAIETFLSSPQQETYVPYLAGSRYSLDALTASFSGLSLETTRKHLLGALVKGNCEYQQRHLEEIAGYVTLQKEIHVTGGSATDAMIRAKKAWMQDGEYVYQEQSSLKGAAILGKFYMEETYSLTGP